MKDRRGRAIVLSLLVSAGFLYLALRGVDLRELGAAISAVDPFWIGVAVVISLLIMIFRTWRWQLELRPLEHVPFGRLWMVTSAAYMMINLLPWRLGEVARPWLLSQMSDVKFSNVVGNLVVEKTIDSIVLVIYMLAGLLLIQDLPAWVRRGALFPAGIAIVLATLVGMLWWRGEGFVERYVIRWLPERFGAGLRRFLTAVLDGMRVLPDPRLLGLVFVVSLALWFLPILSSWVTMKAFHLELPFAAAMAVFIFIGFGTALPNPPGMIGIFQYACVLALGLFGVDKTVAVAYGVVLNAIQLLTLIAQGSVALAITGFRFEDLRNAAQAAQAAEEERRE